MRKHVQILVIVARSLFKQLLRKALHPTQPYPVLPMSIDDAVAVRDWGLGILAEEQAAFDAAKSKLLADCAEALAEGEEALRGTPYDPAVIELKDQARNPVFAMPDKRVNAN